jgi:hypothetical protein
MSRAQRYEERAERCELLAAMSNDEGLKEVYLGLTAQWREMADQVKKLDREIEEQRGVTERIKTWAR